MTEDEARSWLQEHFDVSRETWRQLEDYVRILIEESGRQNLIAASTIDHIWARHIVDSAQLVSLAGRDTGSWGDLGAGAGLPGIVIAILSGFHGTMIEMRRKRVDFLRHIIATIGIKNASVIMGRVENADLSTKAEVISARAYAPIARLVASAFHMSDNETEWLLPKGQNFQNELDIVQTLWHCDAHAVESVTAPDSAILVLRHVRKRK